MGSWIKRIILILVGAGVLFFVGYKVYEAQEQQAATAGRSKKKGGGSRVLKVGFAEARLGELRDELLLTGALKPKETVDVAPKVTGRIEQLDVRIGDFVRKGQLIAELEDDELQQQLRRSEATISVSRASLEQRRAERANAEAELSRAQQLLDGGLISPQEFAQRKTSMAVFDAQVELAEAQIQQVEAELRELKIRVEQTKIMAPMSGAVAQRFVDEGAVVSANTPIIRLVNLSTMITLANVPERNMGKLRVGNPAIVEVDAIPGQEFRGRIARIAPVLDAATRTALVEIDILNPSRVLKAEMFARIQLDTGAMREATLIPREGLVYRGSQPGVYVVDGDRPQFRAIETGLTREDSVEVLANLDAGTKIVARGATMIRDGDRVAGPGAGGAGRAGGGGRSGGGGQAGAVAKKGSGAS